MSPDKPDRVGAHQLAIGELNICCGWSQYRAEGATATSVYSLGVYGLYYMYIGVHVEDKVTNYGESLFWE